MKNVVFGIMFCVCLCFSTIQSYVFADDPHHEHEDICSIERIEGGVEICCETYDDYDDNGNDNSSHDDYYECFIILGGEDGVDGQDGADGVDGEGCTARRSYRRSDCFVIICGDETRVVVCDGQDGRDGYDGEDGEDGISCWDLNGNGQGDFQAEAPHWCHYAPWKPICQVVEFTEDTNGDGQIDVLDCRGENGQNGEDGYDGESCFVQQGEDGCAYVTCGEETTAVICDGADGEDGENGLDGTSCYVTEQSDGVIVICEDSEAFVANGLNCWDNNGNGQEDFCHPRLSRLFEGCPISEDFFIEYECQEPPYEASKAMQAAKSYEGNCGATVSCEEYIQSLVTDLSDEAIVALCNFTEDTNSDGEIDSLDCRGADGEDGSPGQNGGGGPTGPQGDAGQDGEDGRTGAPGRDGSDGDDGTDGTDGVDGEGCDVVDNLDATCTITCPDSSVTVYVCGTGAEPVAEATGFEPCGVLGGLTIIGMLLPLGLMRSRVGRRI